MKTVKLARKVDKGIVYLDAIHSNIPIFVKRNGLFVGMLVEEKSGWIIKLGGDIGATGHWDNRTACIEDAVSNFGYTFHIEEYYDHSM